MVVRGGEHLLAGAQRQAAVDERQPHGGAVRDRHLAGTPFQVFGGRRHNLGRHVGLVVQGQVGIPVDLPPVPFDLVPDAAWMRGEEEIAHMDVVGGEIELRPHPFPVRSGPSGSRLGDLCRARAARQRTCG
ncbi:MAG: hypothetical protein ACRDSG_16445 [Pseudonocardiaceae bacterium]